MYKCQAGETQHSSDSVAMVVTTTEGEVLSPEEQKGKAKARTDILLWFKSMSKLTGKHSCDFPDYIKEYIIDYVNFT